MSGTQETRRAAPGSFRGREGTDRKAVAARDDEDEAAAGAHERIAPGGAVVEGDADLGARGLPCPAPDRVARGVAVFVGGIGVVGGERAVEEPRGVARKRVGEAGAGEARVGVAQARLRGGGQGEEEKEGGEAHRRGSGAGRGRA